MSHRITRGELGLRHANLGANSSLRWLTTRGPVIDIENVATHFKPLSLTDSRQETAPKSLRYRDEDSILHPDGGPGYELGKTLYMYSNSV